MGKRKKRHRGRKQATAGIKFSALEIAPSDHPDFQRGVHEIASTGVDEFPKTLELVRQQIRCFNPLSLMAIFATYGFAAGVDDSGSEQKALLEGIDQHHAELLQAVLLSVPRGEWGQEAPTPEVMQLLFDNLPKLSNTFFHQRLLEAKQITDKQEAVIRSLQDRVRLHTQLVRNWGYSSDVITIVRQLYCPLDKEFASFHGFSISDLIEVTQSLANALQHEVREHFEILRSVLAGKDPRDVVVRLCESVPALQVSPDEMLAALAPNIDREGAIGLVQALLDWRLVDQTTFESNEVAAFSGRSPPVAEKIMKAISLPPGSLVDSNLQYLFLANPVWNAPGIDLGGSFLFAIPHIVFSHIHRIVSRLCEQAGLKRELESVRARFLEEKLGETLRKALPDAKIQSNVQWRLDGQEFETDQLAVLDRIVVIAEAKSNHLTPEGLRGAPGRVKRHVKDLVLTPSVQSYRLKRLIHAAQEGNEKAGRSVRAIGIDPSRVDRVICLSVTLDDLSPIWSEERKLKEIEWVPADHALAPTFSIADLMCLVDILDDPIHFLHYVHERSYIQKSLDFYGDEMDLLGLYLGTGFNLAEVEKHSETLTADGLSRPIDHYYDARDFGFSVTKPTTKHSKLFRAILDRLCQNRPHGWITAGLHLLNSTDYSEQLRVEKELLRLRRYVRRKYRKPNHRNSLVIIPPKRRKAAVVFYLYPNILRAIRHSAMQQLAQQAIGEHQCEEVCVIGKNIDKWTDAFDTICLVRKPKTSP